MAENVPHSVLINRQRVFVFVRRAQTPSALPIFYGFCDVAGWITMLDAEKFNDITAEELWDDMTQRVSIEDDRWETIKKRFQSVVVQ